MVTFNNYLDRIDLSELKKFLIEKGEPIEIKKKDYLIKQNEQCKFIGYVKSGIFKYTRIDSEGSEHVVGYSFKDDYVGDYPSMIKHSGSFTNIQAVTNCSIYVLSTKDVEEFWESNMDTQRLGRLVAEHTFLEMYERLLSFYCDSAEHRYIALLQRCPNLTQYITLKGIASYLGVTPETVSHIRKKLL